MSRAQNIIKLVKDFGDADKMDDRFALREAIENSVRRMEQEINMLTPLPCCQDFTKCKKSDCVPLLHHKLSAEHSARKATEQQAAESDELRTRIAHLQGDLHETRSAKDAAEESLKVALVRLECSFIEADHLRMQIVEQEATDCIHEKGTRYQAYDSDGCGYYIWRCDACGAETVDDLS